MLFSKRAIAAARGATVEQLIVDAVAKEVEASNTTGTCGNDEVELRSLRPGTLDLSGFDFDDLLARCNV